LPENPAFIEQLVRWLGAPAVSILFTLWILHRNNGDRQIVRTAPRSDDDITRVLGDRLEQRATIEAIERALAASVPFRENVLDPRIGGAHVVRNLQTAQGKLVTAWSAQGQKLHTLEAEVKEGGRKIAALTLTVQKLRMELNEVVGKKVDTQSIKLDEILKRLPPALPPAPEGLIRGR
jgi:hypothetical protein